MRLFLSDHLLRDVVGHHLGYNLALAEAACRSSIEPILVTHLDFDPLLAEGNQVKQIFRTDYRANPPAWIAKNHHFLTLLEKWCDYRFGYDLSRFPTVCSSDLVFAQMVAPRHFLKWLRWMSSLAEPPVLFLHLGYRPGRFTSFEITRSIKKLTDLLRQKIYFVTDSEKLVAPFTQAMGSTVHYLPHIISYAIPAPEAERKAKPITVFVPGNARREKGFVEAVEAAAQILLSPRREEFHFVIQCHKPDTVCSEFLRVHQSTLEGIEWIDRPLSNEEYLQQLTQSDILLLPYHLDCYEMRTSGIFTEARVAGKPVITTTQSWAGDRVAHQGGGWIVKERSVEDLVDTLLAVPLQLAEKREEALSEVSAAKAEFHRDTFMKRLLALIPKEKYGIF